ncbi:hypothetical protein NLJ89_g5974 [Agrocybe chaxingu]|uniref:Ankyrin n=1 Tax=Agrocybe chaxingu TaxID=84603 RepID=A0A9W8K1J7_9AGAR|nr:hypothetical protein NLJ89_g5974 [Agrocybe chaxingu]
MPVPLRTPFHKAADAKYNVTTEFPSLGLHAAAATGNVGLVEYALDHGQPVNSVLDGVLPLHAACAGGNVQIVKVLIDHGADVNAPRLPRKYSDKNRDASAPIVGTSGSTPLHFAAANGNTEVVRLLLLHGAHANRADKHGVTPETLAQEQGWLECAKLLREWIQNKDRDLKEREGYDTRTRAGSTGQDPSDTCSAPRRRIHVKHSIDTALNMLKPTDSYFKGTQSTHTSTPPASPHKPLGEYTFYPVDSPPPIDPGSRRPSLPQILQPPPPNEPGRNRKPSSTVLSYDRPRQRRPQSAGTGADRNDGKPPQDFVYPYGRGGSGRKLGSKYSLINIFKKAQAPDGLESTTSESGSTHDSPAASVVSNGTPPPLPTTLGSAAHASTPDLSEGVRGGVHPIRAGFMHRGSDASTKGGRVTPNLPPMPRKASGNFRTPPRTNAPLAVEMHLALAQQQRTKVGNGDSDPTSGENESFKPSSPLARFNQTRSPPSATATLPDTSLTQPETIDTPLTSGEFETGKPIPSPSMRPGILRGHNRTSSTGQGSPLNSRTLRFDSTSSVPGSERKAKDSPRSVPLALHSHSSISSLNKFNAPTSPEIVEPPTNNEFSKSPASKQDLDDPDQDESYGELIVNASDFPGGPNVPSVLLQRQRGLSFASSSQSSLSPILSSDYPNDPSMSSISSEFPFSINRNPPPLPVDDGDDTTQPTTDRLAPMSPDTRGRGDSLSSDSTSDSRSNPPLSSSITSGSGTSVTVSTPGLSTILSLPVEQDKTVENVKRLDASDDDDEGVKAGQRSASLGTSINERRAHTPLDIDISLISSHAQAEALVERARQDALESLDMAGDQDISPPTSGAGRTPLSARLAAYGESLALAKRLKEQKEREEKENAQLVDSLTPVQSAKSPDKASLTVPMNSAGIPRQRSRDGVERQLSLEHKSATRVKRIRNDPRRPSTADGLTSRKPDTFFSERSPTHHPSRSASNQPSAFLLSITSPNPRSTPSPQNFRASPEPLRGATLKPEYSEPSSQSPSPGESLTRISSVDFNSEADTCEPVPTGPSPARAKHSKKLTKMGYSANEQAEAAAATRTATTSSTPPTNKRFGALKSFFKGKA